MRLAKTDRARAALQARDPAISVTERRVLILCDGNRSDADVAALLGAGAAPAIARLLAAGYLQLPATARTGQHAEPRDAPARSAPSSALAPHLHPDPRAPATAMATEATDASTTGVPGTTKRSLLAARMYLLDMLALQRALDTGALQSALREARSADATLDAIADALARLQRATSPSYGERVRARLLEVLPIDQLDAWAAIERGRRDRSSPAPAPMTPAPQLQPSA